LYIATRSQEYAYHRVTLFCKDTHSCLFLQNIIFKTVIAVRCNHYNCADVWHNKQNSLSFYLAIVRYFFVINFIYLRNNNTKFVKEPMSHLIKIQQKKVT